MSDAIRVMTVEDAKSRGALAKLVGRGPVSVVAESGFGQEALTVARETSPDIVLVRFEDPLVRSLRTIELLTMACPTIGVIALTSSTDREVSRKAIRAGARDSLTRPFTRDGVLRAISEVFTDFEKRKRLDDPEHRRSLESGELIVVYGAKGGIGKTTLAVNLASALANESEQRVVLVDLDVQMGDVALFFNLPTERSLADATTNLERLEGAYLQSLAYAQPNGLQVLTSPIDVAASSEMTGGQIAKVLEALSHAFDYVVVDTSHSLGDVTIAAIERATLMLLVTAPDLPSLKRTKIALRLLQAEWNYPPERVRLVLNHPYSQALLSDSFVVEALDTPIAWSVPFDRAVPQSTQNGRPCIEERPRAHFSRVVVGLARSLAGRAPARRGLFSRLGRG